ncbi:alpha-L-arabinofuranosidase C-terminal domain-containing protein [Geothrix sp. PMB-07]|uniref:alpha-L-arabinofuranosidase C-terminal domain-containing protein n=1 Tax=Geothrix sp. PMB-07 TaxID=3068640 RepID=UPI00274276FB|nr:alpha-L-arabinofuranosidase C-terminal domain-containing protein [Geothrix sp. PMB-07]WLT30953.1 alpha-L-arabinofuranosidase C-terminal domain-containing protein [Geothrix sp. PMB-07]
MRLIRFASLLAVVASIPWLGAQLPDKGQRVPTATLTVDARNPGAAINPAMWGVFFEDINFAADGGLWAELVKNRSFEFPNRLQGWYEVRRKQARGTMTILDEKPAIPENPHFLRLQSQDPGEGYGVGNEGFRGMGIKAGEALRLTLWARRGAGAPVNLRATLRGAENRILAGGQVRVDSPVWAHFDLLLSPANTDPGGRLELTLEGPGQVDLDAVSLMPMAATHGFRPDLMRLLADLKPGFVRFPGGCVVEGHDLANRYQWKRTVGPVDARRPMPNRWLDNLAGEGRFAADYQQSFQLGFFEFFQLCADLGAEPLPVLSCGMACQFETSEMTPLDQLEPFIQDALDLIEFANGAPTTPWGKVRRDMGHEAPFGLKFLAVGNEQSGPEYLDRFSRFEQAIKAKHPQIQIIGSAGPWMGGEDFDTLWAGLRARKADLVDEHYYAPPSWFFNNAHRYDSYPRTGPKVFAGEYAAHPERPAPGAPRPNSWEAALSEAAFMTGLERNADVVRLASYAPLLACVDAWQWSPNLIWFDSLQSSPTPSYWVQQLFSRNRASRVLPVELTLTSSATATAGLYTTAALDETTHEVVLKVVNAGRRPAELALRVRGAQPLTGKGRLTVLSAGLADENLVGAPPKVTPATTDIDIPGPEFTRAFPAQSLTILRLPLVKETP